MKTGLSIQTYLFKIGSRKSMRSQMKIWFKTECNIQSDHSNLKNCETKSPLDKGLIGEFLPLLSHLAHE
jgi:hypothetical protein